MNKIIILLAIITISFLLGIKLGKQIVYNKYYKQEIDTNNKQNYINEQINNFSLDVIKNQFNSLQILQENYINFNQEMLKYENNYNKSNCNIKFDILQYFNTAIKQSNINHSTKSND